MESRLYFSAFVLSICAIHLVWTASAWADAWWKKNMTHAKKTTAAARNGTTISKESVPQRSDWYAFFHCSDLIGKDSARDKTSSTNQNKRVIQQKNGRLQRAHA